MKILIIAIAIILCLPTMAGERSEQEILDAAASVLCKQRLTRSLNSEGQQTLRIVQRRSAVTIVGADGGGFALVSNDEELRPVLGYSREGRFDADEMPCGMEWYLDALDENLKNIGVNGYEWTPLGIRPDESVKPQVAPLIESDWYQYTPFNDWCPTFVNDKGQIQHHVVGCGALATTQVMHYYRHPLVGQGSTTYSYDPKQVLHATEPVAENMLELSCDFDTVHFDWNSMATHYGNKRSSDEAANVAVARLCKAVGIAMHMKYTETSGSGSSLSDVVRALSSHFGYSQDVRRVLRSSFADNTWAQMVFEELSNGRPIIYGGNVAVNQAGHFFVLDGYDADGLFHINWGWGRNSYYDGYFDLNYLSPNNYNTHYSVTQGMAMMAHPEGTPIDMTEVNVKVPGSLSALLPTNRSLRLRITGTLNASDIRALRRLGSGVKDGDGRITEELTHLDLSQASIVGNVLPDSAFFGCTQLMQLELPSSVAAIGSYAFASCHYLTHLTLPRSLTTLGTSPFASCVRLTDFSVEEGNRHFATIDGILTNANLNKLVAYPEARSEAVIPSTIDSIGPYAFRYCFNLSEVRIPSHVRVICEFAFQNCTNLQQVTLEEGVERILAMAFNNCDSLRTLHLPASIDSIGLRLFIYSDNMRQVTMAEGNPNFRVENNCLLSHDGKQLVQALLTEVETVDIPASVETTEKYAFYGTKMTHLTIPSTLKKIGNQSIYFCENLTQLDIEDGVEQIDNYAFNGCSALTEVHLPASLQAIGYAVFVNCKGLHHVDISEASPLFLTDDNMLFSKDGTQLLQQFVDDKEEYTVPETVTTIAPGCFRYLTNLHKLTIPTSVKSIGSYVFYGSTNISDVFCLSTMPLRLSQWVFDLTDLSHSTLHVPEGCRYAYSVSTGWQQFGTIVEDQPNIPQEEEKYQYNITFNITRSSQTAFNRLVVLAPCPQTNEYQKVQILDITSNGVWKQGDVAENQNKFLELDLSGDELKNRSLDFSVDYSFVLSHKPVFIDFSPFKASDGSWKDMPDYDTSQQDYIDNTKQSGEYVVPDNSTIKAIADQLFAECGGNRLAYAERCYEYVASHFKYLKPGTGLHTLADILSDGGGDCGNLSSIYISLLRAKGIPARHVVAIGGNHVWSEFYIQDFGWVPVDVTYKNSTPSGNYFGVYDGKYIVVQKGVAMDYPTYALGTKNFNIFQGFHYWYWTKTNETLSIAKSLSAQQIDTISGDANDDGKVSVTDIAVIVNHILSIPNGAGFSIAGADANGDGKITVTDIGVVVDIILGNNANTRVSNVLEPQ